MKIYIYLVDKKTAREQMSVKDYTVLFNSLKGLIFFFFLVHSQLSKSYWLCRYLPTYYYQTNITKEAARHSEKTSKS